VDYSSVEELIKLAEENDTTISEIVQLVEKEESEESISEIRKKMMTNLIVMKDAVHRGLSGEIKSSSGLVGGESHLFLENDQLLTDGLYKQVIAYGLAVAEVNAGMGRIVAGPTAGSSGIIPAVIIAMGEKLNFSDEEMCDALFTASGFGEIVALNATLAGAAGGCQAECGAAAAMAAGAAVEMLGGTPEMAAQAFALALKNLLGLVCDPVAGLVEVPCVKRNGFSAAHAITAVSMAMSGIESVIPPDEVISAMAEIGDLMHSSLKETAEGGLAVTPTGLKIKERLKKN